MTEGKVLYMSGWLVGWRTTDETDGGKEISENTRKYLAVRSLSFIGVNIIRREEKNWCGGTVTNKQTTLLNVRINRMIPGTPNKTLSNTTLLPP
jgi:hypothetical protein